MGNNLWERKKITKFAQILYLSGETASCLRYRNKVRIHYLNNIN